MNPFSLPAKSGPYGGARDIPWEAKGLSGADKEVAAILLQLPRLVFESNSLFIWGGEKKKRQQRKRRLFGVINKVLGTGDSAPVTEEASTSKQWDGASSPDTPLIAYFSPTGTESKHRMNRKPVKRRREEKLLLVTQLEKERDLLRKKIENLRHKKDRAIATNTLLKRHQEVGSSSSSSMLCNLMSAINSQLIFRQEREKVAKLGEVNTSLTLGMQWTQPSSTVLSSSTAATIKSFPGGVGSIDQQQPLMANRTVVVVDNSRNFVSVKVEVGPQHLLDLNLPADEGHVLGNPQPLDRQMDKMVMATLARQNRCRIYKAKAASVSSRRILAKGVPL